MGLIRRAISWGRSSVASPPEPSNSPSTVSYEQNVRGANVSEVRQRMNIYAETPELFVHLTVAPREGKDSLGPGEVLRMGVGYRARATASLNRRATSLIVATGGEQGDRQTAVRPGRPLVPLPASGPGVCIRLTDSRPASLQRTDWDQWSYEFEFALSPDQTEDTVELRLDLKEEGSEVIHPAVTLSFRVEGAPSHPPDTIQPLLVREVRPPDGTVFLHVVPHDETTLRVTGWAADADVYPLDSSPVRRPRTATNSDGATYRLALLEAMNDFVADEGGRLAEWLAGLVNTWAEQCCVVVVDQDATQAPWELLKIAPGRYLGAESRVVRWADLGYRNVPVRFPLEEVTYAGGLAALIEGDDPEMVAYLGNRAWIACEDLVDALLVQQWPVGVLYLSSRGLLLHGDEGDDALAQLPALERKRVRFDDLDEMLNPRPLILADAPFSGRLLFCGGSGCGLARATMQRLAAGFVGTLGPVDRGFALGTVRRFLDQAAGGGVHPAELLREVRAEALRDVLSTTGEKRKEAKNRLLNASMFVYYGGPRARVRIVSPEEGGNA